MGPQRERGSWRREGKNESSLVIRGTRQAAVEHVRFQGTSEWPSASSRIGVPKSCAPRSHPGLVFLLLHPSSLSLHLSPWQQASIQLLGVLESPPPFPCPTHPTHRHILLILVSDLIPSPASSFCLHCHCPSLNV